MMNKLNKITWVTVILAIILLILVFYFGFLLGKKEKNPLNKVGNAITISYKNINEENFTGKVPEISGNGTLVNNAQIFISNTINEFRILANKNVPEMKKRFGVGSPPSTYEIDIEANLIKGNKTESIVISNYEYTGGANGNSTYKVFTSSIKNGEILSLKDIIQDGKQSAFVQFVKDKLQAWIPPESDVPVVFKDDVNKLTFDSFKNWSLDSKNLIIYFDKYEIGPGALGSVPFSLPLDELKDFLKDF